MMSLREFQSVEGRNQELALVPAGTSEIQSPGPEQFSHPAPAEDSRDDGRGAGKAP
jgi:hypothetical protein